MNTSPYSFMLDFKKISTAIVMMAVAFSIGCGPAPPQVVTGGGVITVDGEPLEHVEVRFTPMHEGADGNHIARGVSDSDGKFVLKFPGGSESSVVAGLNKVTISEGPMPEEARGQSRESQMIAMKFGKEFKYRPIPKKYQSLAKSGISFEVGPDETEYNIDLSY